MYDPFNLGLKIDRPIQQKYFLIKEVSKIINEAVFNIREWDNYFEVCHRRNDKGKRLFSRVEVAKLHMIKNLIREQKYTREGAKLQLQKLKL